MKKVLITIYLYFFTSIVSMAQRYRRSYEIIGLADSEKIEKCLEKGLPLFLLGIVIFFICANKKSSKYEKEQDSWWGCFSLLLIGIGLIIMLPLLAWIEAIIVSIISILTIIGVIILIWKWITK